VPSAVLQTGSSSLAAGSPATGPVWHPPGQGDPAALADMALLSMAAGGGAGLRLTARAAQVSPRGLVKMIPMDEGTRRAGTGMGFWAVVAVGVGGMVGGGIFAVLGLAGQLAQGGTPVAFAVAGLVALLTSHAYAKLSVAYPSEGGTVEFLNQAFGPGLLTGSLNVLLWFSYVVMLSLYAYAFGSYGASFFPKAAQPLWHHILVSGAVVLLVGLNALGAAAVGRFESWVVAIKVAVLLLFVGAGAASIDAGRLSLGAWSSPLGVVAGGMVIFLAYEGFELIANAAADVRDAARTLPRAYYTAVLFVIALYITVAAVSVGNLPIPQLVAAKDYALAAAAKPFLGAAGFTLIAVAALLSTASAINATLYGASRLSYVIAKEGELPVFLERKVWQRPIEGLLITGALTLVLANALDLSSISVTGSAGFLLIFGAVNAAALKLWARAHISRWLSLAGLLACAGATVALLWQRATVNPRELLILPLLLGVSVLLEALYRVVSGRTLSLRRR
jgi:amino acid transporter